MPLRTGMVCAGVLLCVAARAGSQAPGHARLVAQLGHTNTVYSVSFSADGRLMVSAGGKAVLWEVSTGRELRHFETYSPSGRNYNTTVAALSPNGRWLITNSGEDRTARLWDAVTGRELHKLDGHFGPVEAVCFSSHGGKVLTAGGRTAVLWNAESGAEIRRFETVPGKVAAVAFSPDEHSVLTAGGRTATLWNAATGQPLWRIQSPSEVYTSVAFSSDGREILIGGEVYGNEVADTGLALMVDARSGRRLRNLDDHKATVTGVALTRDGSRALAGSYDGTAREWETLSGRELAPLVAGKMVRDVAYSPDGRHALLANRQRSTLFDLDTRRVEVQFEGRSELPGEYVGEKAAFAQGDQYLLIGNEMVLSDGLNTLQLWDLKQGGVVERFRGDFPHGAFGVRPAADGHYQLTTPDGSAALPLPYANSTQEVPLQPGGASGMDEPGDDVGTTSDGEDPNLYDPALDAEQQKHPHPRSIMYLRWGAPCGDAGEAVEKRVGYLVEFSNDCRIAVASGNDGTSHLMDVATGNVLVSLASFDDGSWAVFDPEGRFDTNQLDGGAQLQWVVDDDPMHALPLEIFMRDYYTPRLLATVLKGEQNKLPPVRSIAEIKNRAQPVVSVKSVAPSKTMPGRVDVVVHAASVKDAKGTVSGLQGLRLFRDGELVAGGGRDLPMADKDYEFRDIRLKSGAKNVTFTAYAFNSERIKSATASLDYVPPVMAVASAAKPHAYLLQIGVNHVQAEGCELQYSGNDAEKLSAVLKTALEAQGMTVVPVILESPTGGDAQGASKARIHAAIDEIAAKATPDDAFFLSFSGHGYTASDGQYYIIPSDLAGSCFHIDKALLASAISADELAEWLRPLDAGEMAFVLDACHSAESVEAGEFKPGPMGSRGLGQLAYDKRMRILVASQASEVAVEYDKLHQGLLSYVLTQDGLAAHQADWKPKNGEITVGEWLSYAANAVPKFDVSKAKAAKAPGQRTTPDAGPHAQVPAVFDFSRSDGMVLQRLPAGKP